MILKAIDNQHFYIDDQLIDLVWIGYHAHRQSSGANHHDVKRNLNWLGNFAQRLLVGKVDRRDERRVKRKLAAPGYDWSFTE